MGAIMPIMQFKLAFDATPARLETQSNRFDSLEYRVAYNVTLNRPGINSLLPQTLPNRFDGFRHGGIPLVYCNRFTVAALRVELVYNRLNIVRELETHGVFGNRYDAVTLANAVFPACWDSANDYPLGLTRLAFAYESNWAYRWRIGNRFQVISKIVARVSSARWPGRFNSGRKGKGFLPVCFNVIPQDFATYFRNRFNSLGAHYTLFPARKQALVRPGWKILAKNIATNELFELGFIAADEENSALENVLLPDGDYEIQVLTSSLFWKDTMNNETRTISIRLDGGSSPLPTIYNLRSTISQGETTILWSANKSKVSDCVFGVWYSSSSPVATVGPPSETVWYSSEMTEYQTSIRQNAPCYAAVSAIRTGNEPEMGKIHEIYLDWRNVKPRHPDDVVIFDTPLSAYDANIMNIEQENPEISLWG